MKKQLLSPYWLHLLLLAAPVVFIVAVWPQIPDRVPVHFNIRFQPDSFAGKMPGVLLLPGAALFVTTLILVVFRFDPKMAKAEPGTREQVRRVLHKTVLALNLLLGACSVGVVYAAWGNTKVMAAAIQYGLPLLLLCLGNYLGKLKPNHTIGIRIPRTLASPAVWTRTHRFAGRALVLLSLGLLAAKVAGAGPVLFGGLLLGVIVGWACLALGYAFWTCRKTASPQSPT